MRPIGLAQARRDETDRSQRAGINETDRSRWLESIGTHRYHKGESTAKFRWKSSLEAGSAPVRRVRARPEAGSIESIAVDYETNHPNTMQEFESELRGRVLHTASRLFAQYGFQAVGVERIVEEAGVAKMTLYRHFDSKDQLISEFLDAEDARIRKRLRRSTDCVPAPAQKIQAFFAALAMLTSEERCFGCAFQMAAGEFPDPSHPANRRALAHKSHLRGKLASWVREAGLEDAERISGQLFLLMEGAWAAARLRTGASIPLERAAVVLLEGERYAQAVVPPLSSMNTER